MKFFKFRKKDDNVVNMEDIEREQRKRARRQKLRSKWENTKKFVSDNKEVIAATVVTVGPIITTVVAKASKMIQIRHENNHRDKEIYDHSTGTWWILKKKISNKQREQLEKRKMNGEKTGQILRSMNLLK